MWKVSLKVSFISLSDTDTSIDFMIPILSGTVYSPSFCLAKLPSEGDGDVFTFKIQVDNFCPLAHKNVRCWLKKWWSICLMLWKTFREHWCLYSWKFWILRKPYQKWIPSSNKIQICVRWNETYCHNKVEIRMQYLFWTEMHLIRHDVTRYFVPYRNNIIIIILLKS